MHIVSVIPLQKGIQVERLSYYSAAPYEIGTLLKIPIRKKEISGIVLECKPAPESKQTLRNASFTLKKLDVQENTVAVPLPLRRTAAQLADYYPAEVGAILFTLLPTEVKHGLVQLPAHTFLTEDAETAAPQTLTAPAEDRWRTYRSLIRQAFARAESVVLVVPSSAYCAEAYKEIHKGLEKRVVVFCPTDTLTKKRTAYERFTDYSQAKVIITTPAHAYLDRPDLAHCIVDRAGNSAYATRTRPHLDHRTALEMYATNRHLSLTFGDILPRCEEEHQRREDNFQTLDEAPKRHNLPCPLHSITLKDKPKGDEPWRLLSTKLTNRIIETVQKKQLVFLYAARRGLAPAVTCRDCGHIFRCPQSGAPFSLVETGVDADGLPKRWFVSSTSGVRLKAADTCPECSGWRLSERGIGIQYIQKELRETLPDIPLYIFDSTTATTHKKATAIRDEAYKKRGGILLGTAMTLPYLIEPVGLSAVTSMDAVRATPTWRNSEDTMRLLLELREKTLDTVYTQSRVADDEIVALAKRGAVETFYDEEISVRKDLSYPPFEMFIHLTWEGTKDTIKKTDLMVREMLQRFDAHFYQAPDLGPHETHYCLLRLQANTWPDTDLHNILKNLPPHIKIQINPDRIV